ncbi:MAG: glycosyl transferase, partial [Pararhizobium sp.]
MPEPHPEALVPGREPEPFDRLRIDEGRLFRALGIGKPDVEAAARRAAENGTTIERELIAHGRIAAETYYEVLARILGLPYLSFIPAAEVVVSPHVDAALARPRLLRIERGGRALTVLAPEAARFFDLRSWIARRPAMAADLAIASPRAIREAVWACRARARGAETVRALFEEKPAESARLVLTGAQGIVLGAFLTAAAAAVIVAPGPALAALHVALTTLFFACIALRLAALVLWRKPEVKRVSVAAAGPLPVYSVVVALHREAAMVGQLVTALRRLNWPRSLIEIKL